MYSMKEVCELCDMTYDTLKFYCNKGLIPNVKRDKNNYRIFSEHDVAWISSLSCLKQCGMSIIEMQQYLQYCLEGQETINERKLMLDKKKLELLDKLKTVEDSIEYIDNKQNYYNNVLNGTISYESNLMSEI
ncbi:MerR family transcriptional regulator [Lactococcus lactis]|uniref:MerR family transcriptional regulator n=1 Tax=Lactococcus lactis TaxID=1358 RepID=UPI002417D026|nr:MerR family transcriptional regulator [Lactococcus lactis]MDG4972971.1 MerR family transcriptional regulator [Lactococcus lactis]